MGRRIIESSDLLLFVLSAGGAFCLLYRHGLTSDEAVATLAGALLGGAALLLGNWINRRSERQKARDELGRHVANLKGLIAAELVNVAAGLIGAQNTMRAAIATAEAGGNLPEHEDLTRDLPRAMPFTDNLGPELLILKRRDIDALATLRSNLAITRMSMDEVSSGRRQFGLLVAQQLVNGIQNDMKIVAEALECFAPERKLELPGKAPELASTILRGLAAGN